jgi:arylsulfatase A-like enzyme
MKKIFVGLLLLAVIYACQPEKENNIPEKPNILLILTDDMGYGDYSMADNPYIKTPNLDKMAEQSASFKYFYVSPVCAPTRASLLTGKYHQRTDVRSVTNGFEVMDPDEVTLAEMLKQEGYSTGIFGKWHLGEYYPSLPNTQGFDEYFGFRTGHTEEYFDPVLEHNGEMEHCKGYITDILTDKATQFMQSAQEQPFFCYLAYNAPHSPLLVDSSYFAKFLDLGLDNRTSRVYGMVENIDENIGGLFQFLQDGGLIENTIVIFMSDNGPISGWKPKQEDMRYNSGLRDQKFTIYEGGIRTQCFWYWKDKWKPFYDTTSIAAHIDVLPTLLDIINPGKPIPDNIDGKSLLKVISGHKHTMGSRTYFENYNLETLREPDPFPGGIARKGKWKMVNGTKLFNLYTDPGEKINLAETYPDTLEDLKQEYMAYYKDSYRKQNFFPKPIKIGFTQENPIYIKPHHGRAAGNIQFLNPNGNIHPSGVDGSMFSNWKEKGDGITWQLEQVVGAEFKIGIRANGKVSNGILKITAGNSVQEVELPNDFSSEDWTYLYLAQVLLLKNKAIDFSIELVSVDKSNTFKIKDIVFEAL